MVSVAITVNITHKKKTEKECYLFSNEPFINCSNVEKYAKIDKYLVARNVSNFRSVFRILFYICLNILQTCNHVSPFFF